MTYKAAVWRRLVLSGALLILTGRTALAQEHGQEPLVSILRPTLNSAETRTLVPVVVHLGAAVVPGSFRAQVDGTDISDLFHATANCGWSGNCDMQGYIPESKLLVGTNIVTALARGPNDSIAIDRTEFQYAAPSVAAGPVSRMIPAVSVQSVRLPENADAGQLKNYQIVVGPGPGFAEQIYTAEHLTCSAGINSMQVLVLGSQTLAPEPKVGGGSGQACFGDAGSLATFLKGLPKSDLVIMNSFLGWMANVDTTAIGGSKYTATSAKTYYYNAIGVVGAAAGTAYESYQPNESHTPRLGRDFLPPLAGSLMLDSAQHYFFAPSSYPELKVTPGELTADGCAAVEYGGYDLKKCSDSRTKGGFWIVAIDRLSGEVTDDYELLTNAKDANLARRSIDDLAYLLTAYYKSNDLLIITTFGTPIGTDAPVTQGLYDAIDGLGGNAYRLPRLTSDKSFYLLISSRDANYVQQHYVLQRFSAKGDSTAGPTHVLLSRNRTNQYVLDVGAEDQTLRYPLGYAWSQVTFQQPQDWPAWTGAELRAYLDLTSSSNHYPSVRSKLGCGGTGTCQPIRSYYVGGIGTGGTTPAVLDINFESLTYYGNADYSRTDFEKVVEQLQIEQGYEKNVYVLYAHFRSITSDSESNFQLQLANVAKTIDNSLVNGNSGNSPVAVDRLFQVAATAHLFTIVPGIGPAAGAIGALMNAVAELTPSATGVPDPTHYSFTVAQLRSGNATLGADLAASITTMFAGIVQDWGKLSTIGAGYGSQRAPWFMCTDCIGANIPLSALPTFALGAKRRFYLQLLPTVYSRDAFTAMQSSDPKAYKRRVVAYTVWICHAPYDDAPADAYWNYPNIANPATSDVFIVTRTARTQERGLGFELLSFPSVKLLREDVFAAPELTRNGNPPIYRLGGGAGLAQDELMAFLLQRPGYLPGVNEGKCSTP